MKNEWETRNNETVQKGSHRVVVISMKINPKRINTKKMITNQSLVLYTFFKPFILMCGIKIFLLMKLLLYELCTINMFHS